MKILIIGNGSTGVENNQKFYINNHTGDFLKEISQEHTLIFAQTSSIYNKNTNLQNFELIENGIDFEIVNPKKSLKSLFQIIRLVRKNDFLYLFYPGTQSLIFALVSIFLNKPFGLYIRGQYYNRNKIDRFILKRAKFILTVSPSIAKDTYRFCKHSEVIKPMISITESDINYNRIFNFDKCLNLLFVGRVEERKGIYELIEIADLLTKKDVSFHLKIVGGGDLFEELNTLIEDKSLQCKIELLGLVSESDKLKGLYDQADIFIFTSHDEGFPRVLYEAMASGLPIFTTIVGGIPGRMEDNKNCIEIPVRNAAQAAEIIYNGLQDHEVLKHIAYNGVQTLEKIIGGELLPHSELLLMSISHEKNA
jgi:glycosyltransferase involved in cell wall biosynthesis